jgi:hypothetical protein
MTDPSVENVKSAIMVSPTSSSAPCVCVDATHFEQFGYHSKEEPGCKLRRILCRFHGKYFDLCPIHLSAIFPGLYGMSHSWVTGIKTK